jgi:hypothetical protein
MASDQTAANETAPYGDSKYAGERSQQDSRISNENARAAAQSAVLINGGAATAVLAFLAKDKIDPMCSAPPPTVLLGMPLACSLVRS